MPPGDGDAPGAVTCPRCGHSQAGGLECNRCGVIFAKARKRPDPPPAGPAVGAGGPVFEGQPVEVQGAAPSSRTRRILLILLAGFVYGLARGLIRILFPHEPVSAAQARAEAQRKARNATPVEQLKVEATAAAIDFAIKDSALLSELGEPLTAQAEPDVEVTVYQGSGRALVKLNITGPRDSAYAHVTLHLEDGVWSLQDINAARARPK